jgi:hypothetical protein
MDSWLFAAASSTVMSLRFMLPVVMVVAGITPAASTFGTSRWL